MSDPHNVNPEGLIEGLTGELWDGVSHLFYVQCRTCGETHRPPECPINSEGKPLAGCGCTWEQLEAAWDSDERLDPEDYHTCEWWRGPISSEEEIDDV